MPPTIRSPLRAAAALLALALVGLAVAGCGAPPTASVALAEGPATPHWIWADEASAPDELVLRRTFRVEGAVESALLVATADDRLRARLDGETVLESRQWQRPLRADLTEALAGPATPGGRLHQLEVRVRNTGGPAGLLLQLELVAPDGSSRWLVSDDSWSWSTVDGARRRPVATLGPPGTAPWDVVDDAALAAAVIRRPPTATPVERFSAPPGYTVDALHVTGHDEGSWVSLCVDPEGRLYTSDQGDLGLWRLTLDPAGGAPRVEAVPADLSGVHGLLWHDDALYAVKGPGGDHPGGLYRLTDGDGDDALDTVERLRPLEGSGGEHGWHGLVPTPDGAGFYVVAGNQTEPLEPDASRVPPVWGEDQLLPRLPDSGGFMTDDLAPGGCVYRVDPATDTWELVAIGFRNPYDLAIDRDGELFTVDSDMEWDLNTPWYRPTRVCHVRSGSDFGWRNGSGKLPPWCEDTTAAAVDLGPGSPVGLTFGHDLAFPARHREALFSGDWSYGRIWAVHLEPDGAGVRGTAELFLRGMPLPVTDLVAHPGDGHLYLVTGGRGVRGGLYRVRWTGTDEDAAALAADERPGDDADDATAAEVASAVATRHALESLHGTTAPHAVGAAWAHLGDDDRALRGAARTALEWQPVDGWRDRALAETEPATALPALLALVRASARDAPHRTDDDDDERGADERAALRGEVLDALARLELPEGDETLRLQALRLLAVTLARLGPPDDGRREALLASWSPRFPGRSPDEEQALATLLVALDDPTLAPRAVEALEAAPSQEHQLALARDLRLLDSGWTDDARRRYAAWFARAAGYQGGASFTGFVRRVRDDYEATLDEEQLTAARAVWETDEPVGSPLLALQAGLGGDRSHHPWTVDELRPVLAAALAEPGSRDAARGRRLFGAAGCFACHRVGGEGGAVGPDLSAVAARFGVDEMLTAVVEPDAAISDQYARSTVRLADGDVLTGHVINMTAGQIHLSTDLFRPGDVTRIDRGLVTSVTPSAVSAMPSGLLDLLDEEEVADLLAWLLTRGSAEAAPGA